MLDIATFDRAQVSEPELRDFICTLLNQLEAALAREHAQAAEIQRLHDLLQQIQGEQGRPHINPQTAPAPKPPPADVSSEAERRVAQPRQIKAKQASLTVTRETVCPVDPTLLPEDAVFKGYDDVIVQDLRIECEVIRFRKEKFYSPSLGRTFLAPLPPGYHGQFGPDLHSFLLSQYFGANVSSAKLAQLLEYFGVQISSGQISHLLTEQVAEFHTESSAVLAAGLAGSEYQHLDETSTRLNGQNGTCHVLTNPSFTAYRTTLGKDRLQVLRALTDLEALRYLLTPAVVPYLARQGVGQRWLTKLAAWGCGIYWTEAEFTAQLQEWGTVPPKVAKLVREELALAAYHEQTTWPPIAVLIVDDAPQWRRISPEIGLCWVHEGRHYKRLLPQVGYLRTILERFLGRFWRFYEQLQEYQQTPDAARARWLRKKFRRLFQPVTDYDSLNEVIARTAAKEADLLRVLEHPGLPLHNNPAELGARQRVRKRDVSFGPRSAAGLHAWDTFMTLVATTRQVGVNFHEYVRDRLRQGGTIRPLAELVAEKAAALHLRPA